MARDEVLALKGIRTAPANKMFLREEQSKSIYDYLNHHFPINYDNLLVFEKKIEKYQLIERHLDI